PRAPCDEGEGADRAGGDAGGRRPLSRLVPGARARRRLHGVGRLPRGRRARRGAEPGKAGGRGVPPRPVPGGGGPRHVGGPPGQRQGGLRSPARRITARITANDAEQQRRGGEEKRWRDLVLSWRWTS